MLTLYRSALRQRRALPVLTEGSLSWLPTTGDMLAFERSPGFFCVVNAGDRPAPPPAAVRGARLLLASDQPGADGTLPPDSAAWYAAA